MIILNVEKYCRNCLDFEPDIIERPCVFENDLGDEYTCGDTVVGCLRRDICKKICKFLKEEKDNDQNRKY